VTVAARTGGEPDPGFAGFSAPGQCKLTRRVTLVLALKINAHCIRTMKPRSWFIAALSALLLGSAAANAAKIVLVAGGAEDRVDIPAARARLVEPFGVDFDASGNLYIVEMVTGNRLLQVDARGVLHHVAGQRTPGDAGDGGPALSAHFNGPHNLAVLPDGNVLIADTWNGRVRRFDVQARTVSTLPGFQVPADRARSAGPYCISLDPSGAQLYIADLRRVHAVDVKTGKSRVVAGNGEKGVPPDGANATEAPLFDPRAAVADRKGNVYILERGGHALRVISRDGKIRTVVNASGKKGADGDGGDALAATMNGPKHLCVDRDDNVIIADAENHLIRKYIPATGKIVRVAGNGSKGTAGLDGPPEACELNRPHGVTVHRDGTLYITDSYNNRILKIVK
jgi:sugar lactone lactonase YvrE